MGLIDQTINNVINLNVIPGSRKPRVHCSQYDIGRVITFNLYRGDDPYTVTGSYLTIEGSKPDGNAYVYSISADLNGTVSNNVVTFYIVDQMANVAGESECELVMYDQEKGTRIATVNFLLVVETSPISDDSTDSNTDFRGLVSVIESSTNGLNSSALALANANIAINQALGKIVNYQLSGNTLYIIFE